MLLLPFQFLAILLCADFLSGLFHWWEDTYGNPNWPILGKHIVQPNLLHHHEPRAFLKGNYWQRNNTSIITGVILIAIPLLFGWFSFFYAACIALASQSNEIHRKAHQSDNENGRLICYLQSIGLLQSRKHHGKHHQSPYSINYCIITNYLNPVLEFIRFFQILEWCLAKVFNIKPLRASAIRGGK